ncbi:MAG: DUF6089 family protein [Ferruginibacter sp.]
MKKYAVAAILFAVSGSAAAQRLSVTAFGGTSNYQGDLQAKRFTFDQSHLALGAGLMYEFTEKIYGRFNFTVGTISSDDKKDSRNSDRNLNFTSNITDIHLGAEYHLFSLYERSITPYVFAGISYFHFNPKAIDSSGNKVALKPLSTEGEGFYPGRPEYKLGQFALPFGVGLKMSVSEKLIVGVELGLRKTFTDYLDDVSTNYVDQATLLANRGQRAVDLAFRGDEVKSGATYPADGAKRGSPKFNDWYYFTGATIAYQLGGNKGGGKNKTGCPMKVY